MTHNSLGKLLLLGMVAALSAAGCNANPVAASAGSQAAVGYKQDARANQGPLVDILWVIDNSGTMAEEQGNVIKSFSKFIDQVNAARINFHIGVTTTDAGDYNDQVGLGWKKDVFGGFKAGQLRKVPHPEITYSADFSSSNIAEETFQSLLETAYSCANNPPATGAEQDLKDIYSTAGWMDVDARGGKADTDASRNKNTKAVLNKVIDEVNKKLKALTYELPDNLKSKSYLDRQDYQKKDGSLDVAKLTKDFSCMALVGTTGWGIERGLRASLQAVEQSKSDGLNAGFIRPAAKFGVIYVTDENDCTLDYEGKGHGENSFKESSCAGRLCDYFLDPSIPEDKNPLMSLPSAKDKLLQALAEVKGVQSVDAKDVIAGAVTGTDIQVKVGVFPPEGKEGAFTLDPLMYTKFLTGGKNKNFQTDLECAGVPGYGGAKKEEADKEIAVCASPAFGRSWSGSRYLRFVSQFPNHYPPSDVGKERGLMCTGSFNDVFETLGALFAGGSTCITNELYGCDEGKVEGDDCGPEELHGKCMKNVGEDRTDLYCSSAVRLVAYPKDEAQEALLESSGFCIDGTKGTILENTRACILRTDLYQFVACPSPAKGMLFNLIDPKDIDDKLKGMPLDLEFTAYPPSDSDEETPANP